MSAIQVEPTVGTAYSTSVTAKSLVQARKQTLKSSGAITLTLRTTPGGQAALNANGAITVKLNVSFAPKGGVAATKLVRLTLAK